MAKDLQPKKTSRNTEQLKRRLLACTNGWSIVPCERKKFVPNNWTQMANDEEAIRAWDNPYNGKVRYFEGTGIRIEGDAFVIDIDIPDKKIADKVLRRYRKLWPEFFKGAIERHSGAVTRAFIGRISKPFVQSQTHKYTSDRALLAQLTPELTPAQRKAIRKLIDKQKVEVFGGGSKGRYFAYEGPHSPGREYACLHGRSPDTVRLDSLPVFPHEDVGKLIDEADKILAAHLDRVPEAEGKKPGVYYDLEPGQTFITEDGEEVELTELEARLEAGAGDGQRGCMTWASWSLSTSRAHCNAFVSIPGQQFMIHNFEDSTTHHWKDQRPEEAPTLEELGELLEQLTAPGEDGAPPADEPPQGEPDMPRPPPVEDYQLGLVWMLNSFALTEVGSEVVRLYSVHPPYLRATTAFDKYYQEYKRPKAKGVGFIYATKEWLGHAYKKKVLTYDMRPDMPFPTYEFEGRVYKNIYVPARHRGEGEVDTYLEFIEHLLPVSVERTYFHDWSAHKYQYPGVPGHVVVMIATTDSGEEQQGTGRGTLFKILERLWGQRYVAHIDFNILTGTSAQGVYTDWLANSVLICVDESREGTVRYGERVSNYENLKRLDTGARWMDVNIKHEKSRRSWIVASAIIASNHADALLLPRSDRRFSVLSNGARLDEGLAKRIYAWMAIEGNMAALAAWLKARDVSQFNAVGIPPMTHARERMMELSRSEVDNVRDQALLAMEGISFTKDQLLVHMQNILTNDGSDLDLHRNGAPQFAMVMRKMIGLSMPGVRPKQQRRVGSHGGQVRAYVRSRSHELLCDAMSPAELAAEVAKNGLRLQKEELDLPNVP